MTVSNVALQQRYGLAYLFIAKALGARVVYQVHGGELPRKFFAGSPLLTAFLRRTLRAPDVVVVNRSIVK